MPDLLTILAMSSSNTSTLCLIIEVGTGSSSHDFVGDFMKIFLIFSCSLAGSNVDDLCGRYKSKLADGSTKGNGNVYFQSSEENSLHILGQDSHL